MFAIIETGGKQYKVSPGQKLKIEKLSSGGGSAPSGEFQTGDSFAFDKVLLVADGENVKVGAPYVNGAKVEAKVLKQGHHKTVIVFKYHSKTRYRKKKGHRQLFTEIEVGAIK